MSASAGILRTASSMSTEKCSQSSSSSWNSKGYGIVAGDRHGLASGSKPPTTSPPTSSLK